MSLVAFPVTAINQSDMEGSQWKMDLKSCTTKLKVIRQPVLAYALSGESVCWKHQIPKAAVDSNSALIVRYSVLLHIQAKLDRMVLLLI
jgi:hypothetical protein